MHRNLFLAILCASTLLSACATSKSQPSGVQASYVRVCRDRRGVLDRRACRGKDDPRRTVLAMRLETK